MRNGYLRGGALYLAVFISLIIAVVLSMLILHAHYSSIEFQKFSIRQSVHRNLFSAFNLASSSSMEYTPEARTLDLFGREADSVDIVKKSWGCYEMIGVRAYWKGVTESMLCLTGAAFPRDTVLVLVENNRPVSVAGKSGIKGLCFIPKAGVKTAHIEGHSFTGSKIIEGEQLPAPQALPAPAKELLAQLSNLAAPANDSVISFSELPDRDTIKNSFLKKTLRIVSPGILRLDDIRLSGNILIQASRIIVGKNCFLDNVLLVSPVIQIQDNFTGRLQAVASDTIITGNEVRLDYPSSLVIVHKPGMDTATKRMTNPAMLVGEKNSIKGMIACCVRDGNFTNSAYLKVREESVISGMVYVDGYLDLQGTIKGMAYARYFLLTTASGVYEQHLLNAVIDRRTLSDFFVSGILFKGQKANRVVKWLN